MENILIIGAHYDDAELGCGGTAAKLVAEGKKVYKLTLTDNVTKFDHQHINVLYETSVRESALACGVLGVKELTEFTPYRCCELTYNTEAMQKIEDLIYKYNIDTVFMHYNEDLNQDHKAAAQLCLTASRHCENVFLYQSNLYVLPKPFAPTCFFDISDYVEKKKEALRQYTGDHNRFNCLFQTNIERNMVWGYSNGVKCAEGFIAQKILLR